MSTVWVGRWVSKPRVDDARGLEEMEAMET